MANRLEKIEKYFVALLTDRNPGRRRSLGTRLLLVWLRHLSQIYRVLVQLRYRLYEYGIFRFHALGCQVISVGNLTVGGTGKTPVVEVFARELQREGRKVAILSRGYKKQRVSLWRKLMRGMAGRESMRAPRVVSDGKRILLNSGMSGDEPFMLATNLPEVAVLVDKNRVKSGRYAINRLGCDTLILDDGFQYLPLRHRVSIVLVDRTNPFGNGYMLPRGVLREPIKNIRRADVIFITKSEGGSDELRDRLRKLNPRAEIIECKHCPRYLQEVWTRDRKELDYLRELKIVVMSGIAAPGGFESEVERLGGRILEHYRFADHHRYTRPELIDIINTSVRLNADAIITTEKDAVRFPKLDRCDVPIYFLRVDIDILSGAESFQQCISRICFRDREPDARAGEAV